MSDGGLGESSNCRLASLIAGLVLAAAGDAGADVEDHLRFRWYRVELILFENPRASADANEDLGARQGMLDAMRLPANAVPLVDEASPGDQLPIGSSLAIDQTLPLIVSDLPPPIWFAGPCVAESWHPPAGANAVTSFDPCLPRPDVDLEAEFRDDPTAWRLDPPTTERLPELPEAIEEDIDERQATLDAMRDYEDALLAGSYVWRRATPMLGDSLRRLRRRFAVLAAGGWHQPVPARDQAQPVLVQLGAPDTERRFALEGWFSVTRGRYIHLGAHLQYLLKNDGFAVLQEQRRIRRGEVHYLDHPALGLLAHVEPMRLPDDLQRRFDDFVETSVR